MFVCFLPAEVVQLAVFVVFPGQVSRSSIPMALRLCTTLPCLSSLLGAKCLELHLSQPCPAPASTSLEQTPSSHRCTCQTRAQGHRGLHSALGTGVGVIYSAVDVRTGTQISITGLFPSQSSKLSALLIPEHGRQPFLNITEEF